MWAVGVSRFQWLMKWRNILAKSNLRVITVVRRYKLVGLNVILKETHIICHSFGGNCLNLKKTKLVTPCAMLGLSCGGTSRSSCTDGADVSKAYRSSLKRKTNTFCRNRLLIN